MNVNMNVNLNKNMNMNMNDDDFFAILSNVFPFFFRPIDFSAASSKKLGGYNPRLTAGVGCAGGFQCVGSPDPQICGFGGITGAIARSCWDGKASFQGERLSNQLFNSCFEV